MIKTTFSVSVNRPFRLDLTALVMRRRCQYTLSEWDGDNFQRVLVIGGTLVKITASQSGSVHSPRLLVTVASDTNLTLDQQVEAQITVQKMLGISVDIQPFSDRVSQDSVVWEMVGKYLGVRPTRFPTVYEALITAIVCQGRAFDRGIKLINDFIAVYGLSFDDGQKVMHAFPSPENLVNVTAADLLKLGFNYRTAHTLLELAEGISRGKINLDQLEVASKEEAFTYLSGLSGVSRWAVEYVLIRGLGMLDVFPADDRNAVGALQRLLGISCKPSYEEVKILASAWHPYEGFVYIHLLLERRQISELAA